MNYENMTKEELVDYINSLSEESNGKYGLVWDKEKEPEKIVIDCEKYIPILGERKEKNILNKGEKNILIEGDNFHALSVLNYTHKGAIDVIYIDPPYNTGKEFVYNDKIVNEEDGYRHSKWLSFMEKRLKLARGLLSDRGTIFISIDYHEFAQLKLLCDKIFGENNFISDIIWNSRKSVSNDAIVSLNHNYTFVYAKNITTFNEQKSNFKLKISDDAFSNPDNDPRGPWKADPFDSPGIRPNLTYEIINPNNREKYLPPRGRCWRTGPEEYKNMLADNRIVFGKNGLSRPQYKRFLSEASNKGQTPKSIWDDVGTTANGTSELENILGEKKFNNPKPVSFIKKIVSLASYKDSIILDFFAGSGTTGQAVLELNEEDGGTRKFIICTNNENNICKEVTFPRIKTVITGFRDNNTRYSNGLFGSLKYYQTEFVDYVGTRDQLYYDLTEKCIPMLCVKSDTYDLVEKNKEFVIYSNGDNTEYSCVYFDIFGEAYDKFIDKVKNIKAHKNLYIFSLGEYVNEEQFKGITNYIIEPIPYKILDLYKNVVKMSKEN